MSAAASLCENATLRKQLLNQVQGGSMWTKD